MTMHSYADLARAFLEANRVDHSNRFDRLRREEPDELLEMFEEIVTLGTVEEQAQLVDSLGLQAKSDLDCDAILCGPLEDLYTAGRFPALRQRLRSVPAAVLLDEFEAAQQRPR